MRTAQSVRVLVVEDDPILARTLLRVLKLRGYETTLVMDRSAASRIEETFDIGVFDIDLPDGDGVSLAEDLLRGGIVHLVTFYTGSVEQESLARARLLGPVVAKTEGFDVLDATIREVMAGALRALAASGEDAPVTPGGGRLGSGMRRKTPR